jgi:hypothetical protein
VRISKNAWFSRFARRERIPDAILAEAVARAQAGGIAAELGSGVIKQRVAVAARDAQAGIEVSFCFAGTSALFSSTALQRVMVKILNPTKWRRSRYPRNLFFR